MKKKLLAAILAALVLLASSGCTRFVEGKYYSETEHAERDGDTPETDVSEIFNYAALRNAIMSMVANCVEYGNVSIAMGYEGRDVVSDMSRACLEVTRQTAMGAFAVDYMTHVYTKSVSSYDMKVYITYKRTPGQIFAVTEYRYLSDALTAFETLLASGGAYMAIRLDTSILDSEYLEGYLDELYYGDKVLLISKPELAVSVFPETGIQRIIEVSVDYGGTAEELEAMREAVHIARMGYSPEGESEAEKAVSLSHLLVSNAEYTDQPLVGMSKTSYGALVERRADSEGIALAFKQLCDDNGISCGVIRGGIGTRAYFWNVVTIDGERYHFDVSGLYTRSAEQSLLLNDERQAEFCQWNADEYEPCEGSLTYSDVVAPAADEIAENAEE